MRDLIGNLAKRFVDSPDLVQVNEVVEKMVGAYAPRVDEGELGMPIGKQVDTIHLLRAIVGCAAMKEKRRVLQKIPEWCDSSP